MEKPHFLENSPPLNSKFQISPPLKKTRAHLCMHHATFHDASKIIFLQNVSYLKSSVVGEHLLTESAVINVISIMHIQMNFNLLFFDEHFATRQTHKFRFHNIRLNRMRNFKAHKPLFQIDRIRPRAIKIDMLIQMANQIALRILLRIAKRTGI